MARLRKLQLSALLTCVGPELGMGGQATGVESLRGTLLASCALLVRFTQPD